MRRGCETGAETGDGTLGAMCNRGLTEKRKGEGVLDAGC